MLTFQVVKAALLLVEAAREYVEGPCSEEVYPPSLDIEGIDADVEAMIWGILITTRPLTFHFTFMKGCLKP